MSLCDMVLLLLFGANVFTAAQISLYVPPLIPISNKNTNKKTQPIRNGFLALSLSLSVPLCLTLFI